MKSYLYWVSHVFLLVKGGKGAFTKYNFIYKVCRSSDTRVDSQQICKTHIFIITFGWKQKPQGCHKPLHRTKEKKSIKDRLVIMWAHAVKTKRERVQRDFQKTNHTFYTIKDI